MAGKRINNTSSNFFNELKMFAQQKNMIKNDSAHFVESKCPSANTIIAPQGVKYL